MHLKRLEAFGFKSFADRMIFDFEPGVTGVVGPNGCGKSNVVDAVKWALGEQRPTSVRGTEMGDVIFAGSGGRKPLGLAEVSLVFDNADRFLPVDRDEVVVTRRLYRDGASEYLLNRDLSRLKDVRDLFMDTGGGRGALAILEQGKIDAVLQENPHERRSVFEEAAGIARYRIRRKETLRKLDHMEESLVRLRDVISVNEKQLRSIRAQAGRAERWRALENELRSRRIELGIHRYERLLVERAAASERVEELAAREEEANARLGELSGDLAERERRAHALKDRVAALESEAGKAEGAAEAALERAASADRLAGELEGRIRWYEDEIKVIEGRLDDAREAAATSRKDGDRAASEVAAREAERAAAETAIVAAREALEATRAVAGDLRARGLRLLEERGRVANARARLQAEIASFEARGARLAARREVVAGEHERFVIEADVASRSAWEAGEAREAARAELADAEAGAHAVETRLADLRDRRASLDRAVSASRSRLDVLTTLRDRHEGLGRGPRRVLEEAERAASHPGGANPAATTGLPGVRGVLADLVETDVADAEAVELALGVAAEAIVVDTFADARRAITLLNEEGLGRALFLCLDAVPPVPAATDAPAPDGAGLAAGRPAPAHRPAADAVRCADDLRPLLDAVLRGTVLVADVETARAALGTPDGVVRAVTNGGEVLDDVGGIAGGRGDGSGHGLLARNAEIRTLTGRLKGEERRLAAVRRDEESAEAGLREARERVGAATLVLREREEAATIAAQEAATAGAAMRRAEHEAGVLEVETREVTEGLEHGAAETARLEAEEQRLAAEAETLGGAREAAERAEEEAEEARRVADERRAEVRIELARATERRDAAAQRLATAERVLRDGERNLHLSRTEHDTCVERRTESIRAASIARSEVEQAHARREKAVHDLVEARRTIEEAMASLEALRGEVGEADEEFRSYRGTLEQFRLAEHESRMRLENLLDRMREEVRVDLEALHAERTAAAAALWAAADRLHAAAPAAAGSVAAVATGPESASTADADADVDVDADAVTHIEATDTAAAAFDEAAAEEAIRDIRRKMDRMGNVNLEALDQIDGVEEQAGDLRTQEQDLVKAREELMEALRMLNRRSRERFVETFDRIRIHFKEMFRSLFGGGKADIFLEEGEDVLEAGVEIVARPPGKELRNISLLSGGERTMTAVALLFAVYKARPSPFCILDEVDAALDEHNISRFTGMLRDFLDKSQFIIITHSKRTMSMCDRLYGISMPEPGVSTRVRLELDQVAEDGRVEAAA